MPTSEPAKPSIRPPDPIIDGEVVWSYNEESDSYIVPRWYFEKLFDYIIDINSIIGE